MTLVTLGAVGSLGALYAFVWALCCTAARADEAMERARADVARNGRERLP